jgi:hypothetical protein
MKTSSKLKINMMRVYLGHLTTTHQQSGVDFLKKILYFQYQTTEFG